MTASARRTDEADPFDLRPRDRLAATPVWILCGQATVVLTIGVGFGAFGDTLPTRVMTALIVLMTGTTVVLGPVGRLRRLVVSLPAAAYLTWWCLSYLWTDNPWLFERETSVQFPLILSLTVLATVLPLADLTRALVASCYVAVAWSVAFTVIRPGMATVHADGTAGWHGAFGHKNAMGPFLLLAIATLLTLGRRSTARFATIGLALFLIAMSRSATTLVVGVALFAFWLFLRRLSAAPPEHRGTMLIGSALVGSGAVLAGVLYLPTLTSALGKDLTLTSRTDIWEGVIWAIGESPVTGYGAGGAWINVAADPARTILRDLGFVVAHAHNGFLEVAFQLGLVGLALFVLLLVAQVGASMRLLATNPTLGTYFLLFSAILMLTSLVETTTFGVWLALLCAFHSVALRELLRPTPTATSTTTTTTTP